ncbi:hypothetical protein GCK72_013977 [Caenorhabditis remanei]|uniref:Tudor domain-containing protein n=1 Tax=Caenorhabditis remanei TaxID=31234 RepID=A0A6A5GS74_CAERE|nr:hypothetical protein GCK72_013977 [Caenorhabditis remanei]KAF1757521.1 hypothetical protein GCK72_013977 [Caenorhabditis remanei]
MDYDKVDHFRDVIKDLNYLARCQITSSSEPFQINMFHPHYDLLNVCLFLLAPRRGQPSEAGVWPPKEIAVDFNRRNGVESGENDDSGADSDFIGDEEEEDNGWNFEDNSATYLRSFPPATKVFRIERIENEWLIYLTNDSMRQKRQEAEEYLLAKVNSLTALPEAWLAFGTACAVSHEGAIKRAAICGIEEHSLNLLLIDYGVLIESSTTEVFSLPNHESVNIEPQLTLISLACFNFIHCSRVEILHNFLPPGTPIHFERERRSKDIPTKGALSLFDGTPIEKLVNETISLHNLDLECLDVLPFSETSESINPPLTDRVNLAFMYKYGHSVIYKKSKLVTSKF